MTKKGFLISYYIFIVLLILLWVIAGWNTDNWDYDNYEARYNFIEKVGFNILSIDFGYDFVEYFFTCFGFSYAQFRIIIYGIGIMAIGILIYRWTPFVLLALLFYMCHHFVKDVVESRNFVASLFVLFSIEIFGKDNRFHYLKLFLLFFVGFTLHMSFILYFVFLCAEYRKWNYWYILTLSIVVTLFARGILGNLSFLMLFEDMDEKVDAYMDKSPFWAVYYATFLSAINGVFITAFYNIVQRIRNRSSIYVRHLSIERYSLIMYNINSLTSLFVIFTVISGSFYARLISNIMLLNIIFFLNVLILLDNKKRLLYSLFLIIYMSFFTIVLQLGLYDEIVGLILTNNSLLY